STDWLAAHLQEPELRLVDGSFTLPGAKPTAEEAYAARHIPGAVFFDIDGISDHSSTLPHMLPSEAEFARMAGALGLGDRHQIVVYDMAGFNSAPRVWWMLKIFGHKRVSLLDGGLPKWLAENRPVTAAVPQPQPATFTALLDARASGRFAGTAAEPRPGLRLGHIPGSLNLPYDLLADPKTKTLLPVEE